MLELKEKVTILYTRNLYMEKLDHMMTVPSYLWDTVPNILGQ